jgi:hypothetical protein
LFLSVGCPPLADSRSKIPLRTKVWSGIVFKRGLSASGGLAEQDPAADESLERDCF